MPLNEPSQALSAELPVRSLLLFFSLFNCRLNLKIIKYCLDFPSVNSSVALLIAEVIYIGGKVVNPKNYKA